MLSLLSHPLRPDPSAALGFGPAASAATSLPGVIPIDEMCLGAHLAPWPGDIVPVGDRLVPGTLTSFNEARPPYLLSRAASASWREPLGRLIHSRVDHATTLAVTHVRDLRPDCPVVIKEVTSTYAADRVIDLMPESRALALVRDPRDLAASFLTDPETFVETEAIHDTDERRAVVSASAETWAMTVDALGSALDGREDGASLVATYERLLAEPEDVLTSACDLVGLDRDRSETREAVAMDRSLNPTPEIGSPPVDLRTPVGSWRELLSPEEATEVERIAGTRLAAFGYEPA